MSKAKAIRLLVSAASYDGCKITVEVDGKPRTLWAGLGNRAGLHSFANELLLRAWIKSGKRFKAKLADLPTGTKVTVHQFRNITRDRGRWVAAQTVQL